MVLRLAIIVKKKKNNKFILLTHYVIFSFMFTFFSLYRYDMWYYWCTWHFGTILCNLVSWFVLLYIKFSFALSNFEKIKRIYNELGIVYVLYFAQYYSILSWHRAFISFTHINHWSACNKKKSPYGTNALILVSRAGWGTNAPALPCAVSVVGSIVKSSRWTLLSGRISVSVTLGILLSWSVIKNIIKE